MFDELTIRNFIPVATRPSQNCQSKVPLLLDQGNNKLLLGHQKHKHSIKSQLDVGYISSSLALETGLGTALCPWKVKTNPGQKINVTIFNFLRSNYLTLPPKVGSKVLRQRRTGRQLDAEKFLKDSKMSPHAPLSFEDDRLKPKVCHQVALIRESGSAQRQVSLCDEGPRESHVHMSHGEELEVELLPSNLQRIKFLVKFQSWWIFKILFINYK